MSVEAVYNAVLEGDAGEAASQVEAGLAAGIPASDILNNGCIAALGEVGRLFEEGEMFVPEMLIAARAMQSAMNILKPQLAEGEVVSAGKVVVGTVAGDLHDIGKNLVGMMMEGAGFEIVDLGTDVGASCSPDCGSWWSTSRTTTAGCSARTSPGPCVGSWGWHRHPVRLRCSG